MVNPVIALAAASMMVVRSLILMTSTGLILNFGYSRRRTGLSLALCPGKKFIEYAFLPGGYFVWLLRSFGFSRLHIFACAGLDDNRLVSEMRSDLPSYDLRVCTCPKLSLAWSECLRVAGICFDGENENDVSQLIMIRFRWFWAKKKALIEQHLIEGSK